MHTKLTVQERLKDLRVEKGLTLEQLAEETQLSRSALGNYETNEDKDINPYAIIKLAEYYGVSTDYLLGVTETKNHPNTELSELCLSDDMIDLLTSGKINNRLFCEFALHPEFPCLMADMEIYVDGMVAMQIGNLNSMLETVRQMILEKYDPEEDNNLRTLKAAQLQEDKYFAQVISNDVEKIITDLKEAHKDDSTSADDSLSLDSFKADIEEAYDEETIKQYNGLIMILCKKLEINSNKLTEEEKRCLVSIGKKSNLYKRAGARKLKHK